MDIAILKIIPDAGTERENFLTCPSKHAGEERQARCLYSLQTRVSDPVSAVEEFSVSGPRAERPDLLDLNHINKPRILEHSFEVGRRFDGSSHLLNRFNQERRPFRE